MALFGGRKRSRESRREEIKLRRRARTVGKTIALKLDEKKERKKKKKKNERNERRGEGRRGRKRRTRSSRSDVRSLIAARNRKRLLFKRTMEKGGKGTRKKRTISINARGNIAKREREREREKKRERSNRRKLPFRDVRAVNVIRMVVNSPLWTRRTAKFFNGKPFRTCYRLARSPYLEPDTSTGARIFPFTVEIFAEKEKERKKEKILASVCIKNTSFCLNWGWSLPRNLQLVRKVLGFLSTYWKFQPLSTVVSWP